SAVSGLKGPDTNLAFIEVARRLLPDWLVGVVAGGAALCAIVVLAASSLVIGTLVSRNVLTGVKEEKQKSLVRVIIAIYLAVSIVLTLVFPNLMGALINTSYYGITQLAVAVVLLIAGSRVRPSNIAAGLLAGAATAVGIYLSGADLGGLNIGVPSLAVNVAIVVIGRLVWPAKQASEAVWVRKKHR
ncbi:MAG TPA: sodium:solute symporter, partial [Arthrobacter bacterium]|nr:sodium:solute symporter [Arthrobacter sp.]